LPEGHTLNDPEILFSKIEDNDIQIEIDKLKSNSDETMKEEEKISIEDFKKINIKIAEIITAEKITGTNKLMKLNIRIANENRQIIAGIAQYYNPEELIGKKISVIVNLKPARIHGLESNGMLLTANDGQKLSLLIPEHPVDSGSNIS
jgi:methionyl-tRNA synthetase